MAGPPSYKAPTGTHDVLPPQSGRWASLIARFAAAAGRAGYGLVVNPVFEDVEVFRRVGEGTDIVRKEMYEFEDKGGRRLALRPEGTAPVVRAFVQHRPPVPWKVWYAAPGFRYERPQAGRYRQHHQLGVEAIGSADPDVDVEVVALAWRFLAGLGLQRTILLLNSMGDPESRAAYVEDLRAFLRGRRAELAPEDREKVDDHPMRVLDSKRAATRAVTREAPRISDHLTPSATGHFSRVQAGLSDLGVPFALEPRLVRGLDYYTHTTFEIQSSALDAAQNALGGGGRYDGLVEALGGPPTPGIGFGIGIERVLLACDAEATFTVGDARVDAWVIDVTGGAAARALTHELREAGVAADRGFDDRSMKAQMKAAGRSGARVALIVGEQEAASSTVTLRDLATSEQRTIARADVVAEVRAALDKEPR